MISETKIYAKTYDFILWLFPQTLKFPKSHRFVLAQRIENTLLDFLECIIEANAEADKLPLLKKADVKLEKLRTLVRLSKDFKFMSLKAYEYAAGELEEIGRMLGGWIRQNRTRNRSLVKQSSLPPLS